MEILALLVAGVVIQVHYASFRILQVFRQYLMQLFEEHDAGDGVVGVLVHLVKQTAIIGDSCHQRNSSEGTKAG